MSPVIPPQLDLADALGAAACLVDRLPPPEEEIRRALAAALPSVLLEFYARLGAVPEYAALLGDERRIRRLRREQERYWRLLLEQPLAPARIAVIRHVAEVHWRLAIDPAAMALAYEFIARRLVERAPLDDARRYAVSRWLSEMVRVDLALVTDALWRLQLDEAREVERELERTASSDPLTGLANRRLFLERLERAVRLHARTRRPVGLLRLDVDHFKTVNDVFGHDAGDRVLVEVARRLSRSVREGDTAARIGGDEFAVLVQEGGRPADLARLGHRLREALARPVALDRRRLRISASIGWAVLPDHATTAEELLAAADAALYEAKRGGRDRVVGARRRVGALARDWLHEFAASLGDGRLLLLHQPQVSLEDGRLRGFEALVRWDYRGRRLGPARFLERVVRSALLPDFTYWSVERAVAFAARLRREHGFAGVVAVNLCHRQLCLPDLVERVAAALDRHRLPPGMLELEITEDVLVEEEDRTLTTVLHELGELGVRLALDDFGTGWAALSCLEHCPIHTLKIDVGFVRRLGHSARSAAIVRAVCRLARAIEADTVAEGVEQRAQARELRSFRCGHAQGYLFAPPLEAREALAWVAARSAGGGRAPVRTVREGPAAVPATTSAG